jgi:[ribosomal protein S18]-alanine N-acetyltransferase
MSGNQMHNSRVLRQNHRAIIQNMEEEDIDQVVLIEKDSFSDPWSKQSFLDDLGNPSALSLVVKLGREVVGYACLWQTGMELHIGNIAVAGKHRRKGIGKLLMERIMQEGIQRGCESMLLDVRESNQAAINLYEQFGFVHLSRRKGYYRFPNEDALVMLKHLQKECA